MRYTWRRQLMASSRPFRSWRFSRRPTAGVPRAAHTVRDLTPTPGFMSRGVRQRDSADCTQILYPTLAPSSKCDLVTSKTRALAGISKQGRQDSNLQPPVLETGALPIVLLPFGRAIVFGAP